MKWRTFANIHSMDFIPICGILSPASTTKFSDVVRVVLMAVFVGLAQPNSHSLLSLWGLLGVLFWKRVICYVILSTDLVSHSVNSMK